jgi:Putative 2OG-Fe(II) oxygenase
MNATPPLVVPILATPFGVVPLPEAGALNPALTALFTARMAADSSPQADPLCYRSRDDLLERPEEPVRALAAAIFRGVYAVVETVNEFTGAQLRELRLEARGWFTIVKPDGRVPAANYPLTAWCAIYCVAAPPPSPARADAGALRLYETRLGTMFQDATNSAMKMPYKPSHCSWRPVPGHMAVFPASLTHEIALFRSIGELILVTVRVRFVGPDQQGMPRW